jgi:hypothetical protein
MEESNESAQGVFRPPSVLASHFYPTPAGSRLADDFAQRLVVDQLRIRFSVSASRRSSSGIMSV